MIANGIFRFFTRAPYLEQKEIDMLLMKKTGLFVGMLFMGMVLVMLNGTAFADDDSDEGGSAAVSGKCIAFNSAKDYENKAKETEDAAKETEDAAKETEDDKAEKAHEDGDVAGEAEHKAKAAEHEAKAAEHEAEARDHEDKAKDFEEHKMLAGSMACTTPPPNNGKGFLPPAVTSSTGARAYREIHGQ